MTPTMLRGVYDDQVRTSFAHRLPTGWSAEYDGPLVRALTSRRGFAMLTEPCRGVSVEDLRLLVDRTVAFYGGHERVFEWKTFDHDHPELRPLLLAAGAVCEPHEALVLAEASLLAGKVLLPRGVEIRQVTERGDLERVAALESAVWDADWSWLADDLAARISGEEPVEIFVAEHRAAEHNGVEHNGVDPTVVSAAWLTPMPGTRVAGLWGGCTLAAYRGRASIERLSPPVPTGPWSSATRWCRSTPPTRAGRSSNGSGCTWSAGPSRSCWVRPATDEAKPVTYTRFTSAKVLRWARAADHH